MPVLFSLGTKFSEWLSSLPVQRVLAGILRRHKPILKVGSQVFVARHADVKSVLERSDDFGVTEIYAARMERTTGPFVLGMENTEQYARELGFIRAAVPAADLGRIRQLAGQRTDELLAAAKPSGRIDIVRDLARLVPLHLVQSYFGVPGPDDTTMLRWLRNIFWDLFLNLGNEPRVVQAAIADSQGLTVHLAAVIEDHERALAQGQAPDDFVTRLLRLRASDYPDFDDITLRRNIGGVIVGAQETQAKAIVLALEQLLARPERLAEARKAAQAGDDALVSRYVFEALRFNPHNPLIVRRCHRDATLAAGTPWEATIRAGSTVYALTLSAMFDKDVLPEPDEFRTDRPREHYLHFGHGQHQCFGTHMNYVVLPEVIKRVLLLENLRVSQEQTPRIEYEGPFPDRFVLAFDPS